MLYVTVLLVVVLGGPLWSQAAPVVSNVVAEQVAWDQVRITYDLSDGDNDPMMISVRVSDDGGATFDVPVSSLSGAVGAHQLSGTGKEIFWDVVADAPNRFGDEYRVEVIARERIWVVDLPGGATMELVYIPPGTFQMGGSQVVISEGFYLGKYEITEAQWASVMGLEATSSRMPKSLICWSGCAVPNNIYGTGGLIETLNAAAGSEVYSLPTAAQWEYAARGGTTTLWSFGDNLGQLGEYAWFNLNSGGQAHDVGLKAPNPFDLYDVHGNVFEWVYDLFDANRRVLRSGYYADTTEFTKSAGFHADNPSHTALYYGARLSRTVP